MFWIFGPLHDPSNHSRLRLDTLCRVGLKEHLGKRARSSIAVTSNPVTHITKGNHDLLAKSAGQSTYVDP